METVSLAAIGVVFVCAAVLSAHRYQSWIAPAPLWNFCWAILFLSTATLGYGFIYPATPVAVLASLGLIFNIPGFLFGSTIRRDTEKVAPVRWFTPPTWLLLSAALVGLLGAVILGMDLGMSVFSLRSVDELFSFGQQNAIAIFRGEANFSPLVNVAFAVLQFGTGLLGVRVALKPDRSTLFSAIALFGIALLWSSITTQRSYLLVPLIWFVGGYVAARVWGGHRGVPRNALFVGLVLGVSTLLLVVLLRAVRTSGVDAGFSEQTFAPTRLWLAGYVPTFAAWFSQTDASGPNFGLFSGLVALVQPLIGATGSDDGGESNFYYIGSGLVSNAGTSMIRIVGSGGPIWGLLTVLLLATVAHVIYRRAAHGDPVAAVAYIGVVACILWSTNAWFLGYGGRILALVMLIVVAALAQRRHRTRTQQSELGRASIIRREVNLSRREGSLTGVEQPIVGTHNVKAHGKTRSQQ